MSFHYYRVLTTAMPFLLALPSAYAEPAINVDMAVDYITVEAFEAITAIVELVAGHLTLNSLSERMIGETDPNGEAKERHFAWVVEVG